MQRFTLAVMNISWTCLKEELRTHFSKYGRVKKVKIPMDTNTGFNKKLAFVELHASSDAKDTILQDYHKIGHKELKVREAYFNDGYRTRKESASRTPQES